MTCVYYIYIYFIYYALFPQKDARFLKIKNIPDLLSDDKEGKLL